MKKLLFLFLGCAMSVGIYAQSVARQGKVTSGANGEPLIGVGVVIKGSQSGTMTDINGAFSLSATPNDVLVFSFIGYETKEVLVGDKTTIQVTLEEKD